MIMDHDLEPTLVTGNTALVLRAVDTRVKLVQELGAMRTRSARVGSLRSIVAAATCRSATKGSLTSHARLRAGVHSIAHGRVDGRASVVGWRVVAAQAVVAPRSVVRGVDTGGWGAGCASSVVGRDVVAELAPRGLGASVGAAVVYSLLVQMADLFDER